MTVFIGFMYQNEENLMKDGDMDVLSRRTVHALMLLMMINPLAMELDVYSLAHHLCKM
jgi:hypothetical protein